ncbi:MAG: magnesium and cobalt transport protein CorA, partial [Bacteroidetes bacterium]|nr:magnesium and cobalt transport protein CorA [Bacteroidota bacterium]
MNLPKIQPSRLIKSLHISRFLPKMEKTSEIPGTIRYVGEVAKDPVTLHVLDYNETEFTEKHIHSIEESIPFKEGPTVTWLNINGVYDTTVIEDVGLHFNIHPLVLEDIANTTQRPKFEEYDEYLFLVLKAAYYNAESGQVGVEQVSLLIGKDFVVSFQEKAGTVLEALRDRIRNSKGRVRKLGSDYLTYSILDAVIDHYFAVLEELGERIEEVEDKLLKSSDQVTVHSIYRLKQE